MGVESGIRWFIVEGSGVSEDKVQGWAGLASDPKIYTLHTPSCFCNETTGKLKL